ncbi:DoxX family protein [Leptospira barantonii]|uniref:DoxX-like family protein n=1 Tax=Leptospira barantonii TaxID=2023184 RepID=A0ABX4NNX2_9LEPT|nr:DoxX family protein [Leptospira barantonii]PJZ57400.1 DoxX-like family protein [Leptospira barantonii]
MTTAIDKKEKWIKTARWIYWTITLFFAITMIIAGVLYTIGFKTVVDGVTALGYPAYVLKILGIAKILGGITFLQNRFSTLKEWAYAGYSFNLIGASASHTFAGAGIGDIMTPIVILCLVLISYRQWKTGWM